MTPEQARKLLAKRRAALMPVDPEALLKAAFPQQLNFINDPSKLKAIFCTRRAAKSFTAGLYMLYEALKNPGCNCLFVGLTRQSAEDIVWKDILLELNRKFNLKARPNLSKLSLTLPNGSVIRVTGVDVDENEMNKLLGKKYRVVCVDEASMYAIDLHKLIYGILKPATADPNAAGDRGTICMMGTSSNFTRGLFYDITTGKEPGWSLHTWSAHDNPHIAKQWQEQLEEIARGRPLFMETPLFKQWFLNQWVVDDEKLVYRFREDRNLYDKLPDLPAIGWRYALGIDLGYEDDTAFVLGAYHDNDPTLYVLETFNAKHMPLEDKPGKLSVISKIQEYMQNPDRAPSRIIIDGAAKQSVETMRARSAIPFEYADKQGKVDYIEMLNADLIQGKIKLHKSCTALRDEMMGLVWKTDGDKIRLPKQEHPALPNHLTDSMLYLWRCCFHYQATAAEEKIVKGSKAWYAKQAENIWEREREMLEKQAQSGDWPSEDGGWGNL